MDMLVTAVGIAMFVLLAFVTVGGPMAVTDWARERRQRTTELQIALTDAIDGRLGSIVAPVVKRRLLAPWEVAISVPVGESEATGKILAIVHRAVAGAGGVPPDAYRVVLTPRQDPSRAVGGRAKALPPKPWTRHPMGAA